MKKEEGISQKIEILSLRLFDTHKEEMDTISQCQRYFKMNLGWHYCLDLAWMMREIYRLPQGSLILDAGAGSGLLQFILSDLGYNIISADFMKRDFSSTYVGRYGRRVHYLDSQQQIFDNRYTKYLKSMHHSHDPGALSKRIAWLKQKLLPKYWPGFIDKKAFPRGETSFQTFINDHIHNKSCGNIYVYQCDLKDMALLPDGMVDGIVSVSALEHNDHNDVERCIGEMLRVTKPSGWLLITVSASQSEDWFHAPSRGWCYSEGTLRRIFRLTGDVYSNFSEKDLLFDEIRKEGNPLHQRLAPVYFSSGDNGMPWGKWRPEYQPVGIVKRKV
jgi:SAM-dependent methyltransferase